MLYETGCITINELRARQGMNPLVFPSEWLLDVFNGPANAHRPATLEAGDFRCKNCGAPRMGECTYCGAGKLKSIYTLPPYPAPERGIISSLFYRLYKWGQI